MSQAYLCDSQALATDLSPGGWDPQKCFLSQGLTGKGS